MIHFILTYCPETIAGLAIGVFAYLFRCLWKNVQKQKEDQDAVQAGTLALLRSDIISNYDHYMDKEWIPIYAMENVCALYHAYHKLGGNGTVTKLLEELRALPSKKGGGS